MQIESWYAPKTAKWSRFDSIIAVVFGTLIGGTLVGVHLFTFLFGA